MKSNSTGTVIDLARSARNMNAPLSTHTSKRVAVGVVDADLLAELADAGLELVLGDDVRAQLRVVGEVHLRTVANAGVLVSRRGGGVGRSARRGGRRRHRRAVASPRATARTRSTVAWSGGWRSAPARSHARTARRASGGGAAASALASVGSMRRRQASSRAASSPMSAAWRARRRRRRARRWRRAAAAARGERGCGAAAGRRFDGSATGSSPTAPAQRRRLGPAEREQGPAGAGADRRRGRRRRRRAAGSSSTVSAWSSAVWPVRAPGRQGGVAGGSGPGLDVRAGHRRRARRASKAAPKRSAAAAHHVGLARPTHAAARGRRGRR